MEKCPLTNMPCPNKRTIHITEVDSNYKCVEEKHLCFVCGSNFAVDKDPFVEVLSALGKKIKEREATPIEVKKCPKCDFKLSDLIKGDKLGCPECYTVFGEELKPLIEGLHKSTRHVGKTIKNPNLSKKELQEELKKVIKEERYEEAKVIKDKLDKLD